MRILEVLEDSGAYGRLRAGDIVTGLDGIPVSTQETLLGVLRGGRVDDVVRVEGVRAGEPFSFEVQLSRFPESPDGPSSASSPRRSSKWSRPHRSRRRV